MANTFQRNRSTNTAKCYRSGSPRLVLHSGKVVTRLTPSYSLCLWVKIPLSKLRTYILEGLKKWEKNPKNIDSPRFDPSTNSSRYFAKRMKRTIRLLMKSGTFKKTNKSRINHKSNNSRSIWRIANELLLYSIQITRDKQIKSSGFRLAMRSSRYPMKF